MKLQKGDYLDNKKLTHEQYHAVAKKFIEAGADVGEYKEDTRMWREVKYFGWAKPYQDCLFHSDYAIEDEGSCFFGGRLLTAEQILKQDEYEPEVGEICEAWFDSVESWDKVEILKFDPDGSAACHIIEGFINGSNLKWSNKFRPLDLQKEEVLKTVIQIVGDSETMQDGFSKLYDMGYLTKKGE